MRSSWRLVMIGLAALVSCTMQSDYELRPGEPDPEVDEMRRRMRVRLYREDSEGNLVTVEQDAADLLPSVLKPCELAFSQTPGGCLEQYGLDCAPACWAEAYLCIAEELLTWATAPSQIEGFEFDVDPLEENGVEVWTVPPQSSATNAALARQAFLVARTALETASSMLRMDADGTGDCDLATEDLVVEPQLFLSQALATTFVEAVDVAAEATRLEVASLTAVADSQFSDQATIADQTRLAYSLPIGSRSAAGHHAVGGDAGLPGSDFLAKEGFCPEPRLTPTARDALELVRISGLSPRVILDDTISIDELIGGWDDPVTDGLLLRLSVLLSAPHLDPEAMPPVEPVTVDEFLEGFGLDRSDFLHAREHLTNEFRAFGRSLDATLPPQQVTASVSTDGAFELYASTRTPPTAPPSSYWSALVRYAEEWTPTVTDPGQPTVDASWLSGMSDEAQNLATLLDAAATEAGALAADTDLDADARSIIAAFASDGRQRRSARIQYCLLPDASSRDLRVHVQLNTNSKILLVRGSDGLQCAVRGSVEGTSCDLDDYELEPFAAATAAGATAEFPYYAEVLVDGFTTQGETISPLYSEGGRRVVPVFVVAARPGSSDTGPGSWIEMAGAFVPIEEVTSTKYTCGEMISVVPEAEEAAAAAIAPSTQYCAMPAESCAGIPLDQPIPLENELTSDAGGAPSVENSWRHYLDLATRSAELADRLGEDLVRSGLEMDVRAEAAIDELEDICGVSINLDGFGNLTSSVGPSCASSACTDPRHRCIQGQCVLDPVLQAVSSAGSEADAARIAACLGDESTTPWVTLGDSPLCFWWDGSNPATICQNTPEGQECPFEAATDGTCTGPEPPDPLVMIEDPAVPLRYFVHHPEPPPPQDDRDPADLPCAALAQLRTGTYTGSTNRAIDRVLADQLFTNREALRQLADRIVWMPAPGDYSSVRLDGGVWFSTGDPYVRTTNNRWPCAEHGDFDLLCPGGMSEVDPTDDAALFCRQLPADACPSPLTEMMPEDPYGDGRLHRARMNDLLARAVIAARIVSGAGLSGVYFPYYPRTTQDTVQMIDPDSPAPPTAPHAAPLQAIVRNHVPSDATVYYGSGGSLRLDNNDESEYGPRDIPLFDMNRGTLYEVTGSDVTAGGPGGCGLSIPAGAEWSFCPHDLSTTCVEVFDDAVDCDDVIGEDWVSRLASDRDLGMTVRAFGGTADGTDFRAVQRLWDRLPPDLSDAGPFNGTDGLIERMLRGASGTLRLDRRVSPEITRYWTRTYCGADSSCNPDSAEVHRSGTRCWSSSTRSPMSGVEQAAACQNYVGCRGDDSLVRGFYADCVQHVEATLGLEFGETFDGNRAFIAPLGLTTGDVLNGMELMCAAARQDIPGGTNCAQVPEINTVGDLFMAQSFLECQAASIHNRARMSVLRNVPAGAVALLLDSSAAGSAADGEYAAAADDLRAAFIELSTTASAVSSSVDSMASEIGALRSRIQSLGVQTEIADWQLASTTMNQLTSCALSVADAVSMGKFPGAWGSTAITCANSAVQIGIAARITDLQQEQNQLAVQEALFTFEQNFNGHTSAMAGADVNIRASVARMEAAITRIESLQRRGRRALSRALMMDSDPGDTGVEGAMGRQYNVNTVMRRRHNTLLRRYQEAHRNAVRLAFIAKLALEQRLGMPMDEMTEPMRLLDEPPADWHMNVCEMRGIDYDRIRDARPIGADGEETDVAPPEDYAGEFIGDYIRRLELVFESYSFDYPFQDGTDTSVLSLRDEVRSTRAYCPVEGPNLLYEAGQLDAAPSSSGRVGWEVAECEQYETWPPGTPPVGAVSADPPPSCLEVVPLSLNGGDFLSPLPSWHSDFGSVGGYEVHFGQSAPPQWRDLNGSALGDVEVAPSAPAWRHTAESALRQWVYLPAGRYRRSAFVGLVDNFIDVRFDVARLVETYDGGTLTWSEVLVPVESLAVGSLYQSQDELRGVDWARLYSFFDIPDEGWVSIGFRMSQPSPVAAHRSVRLAGIMLENVTTEVTGALDPELSARNIPQPFFNTSQTRTRDLQVCEDTTGAELRRSAFRRTCVGLCPDGYGNCPGALEQHCYYETSFTLGPEALQRGGLLGGAGFAFGNYNYRVDDIGINVVGTGIRDCSEAETPSTCYSSGNVAYSIVHQGPYPVRNHRGDQYDAPLFTGRIERARALAAERYLTNPLSGADRGLIEPYMRHELRGRPLTGTYVLRIWDDPGLVWENVEDVQIVLNYRYWTRQEE